MVAIKDKERGSTGLLFLAIITIEALQSQVEQLKKQLEGAQQFPTRDILDKTLASMEGK